MEMPPKSGKNIRHKNYLKCRTKTNTLLRYPHHKFFKTSYEEPWEDEEWKSFGGARKGLTCTRISLNWGKCFAGVNAMFSSIREPRESCDGGGLSDLWRAHGCQVDPAKWKLCSKSRQSVVSERTRHIPSLLFPQMYQHKLCNEIGDQQFELLLGYRKALLEWLVLWKCLNNLLVKSSY